MAPPPLSRGQAMTLNDAFRKFSLLSANALGSTWMFAMNVILILVWLVSGPFFAYSDTWQLIVNTVTTVLTYLAVFLIQNTQNRDSQAIHLKLNEVITSMEGARNKIVDLKDLSDEELEKLEEQFQLLRKNVSRGDIDDAAAVRGEPDKA
jgi:low affinity Fe/Cu permease